MKTRHRKGPAWKTCLKWTGLVLPGLFLLLITVPYLVPVDAADEVREFAPFEDSKFVEVDGVWLHYRVADAGGSTLDPVLFVHGLGGSTYSWRHQVKAMTEAGYPVIRVDLPVFGYSDRERGIEHTMDNRSKWLWGLLDELAVDQTHLVGHSMGGGVITQMVYDEPDRVTSLTYVAGAVYNDPPGPAILGFPPLQRAVEAFGPRVAFTENRIEDMLDSAYGQPVSQETVDAYMDTFAVPGTAGAWVDLLTTSGKVDTDGLTEIETPAFIVWGEADGWVSHDEGDRLFQDLKDPTMVMIEGSGHMPMETDPEWFNEVLLDFYERLENEAETP